MPPNDGVAANVPILPKHAGLLLAAMLTDGVVMGVTTTVRSPFALSGTVQIPPG